MSGVQILIVDDDRAFCEMLTELLTEEGYCPITCTTLEDARHLIRRAQPALLVLDVRFSGSDTNGWEFLRCLRANSATGALPVIVCSADQTFLSEHRTDAEALGCVLLEKPFDLGEFLRIVCSLITAANSPHGTPHVGD